MNDSFIITIKTDKQSGESKVMSAEDSFETKLRNLCGYIENATDTSVKVFQDDATKEWIVKVGNNYSYYGVSMQDAFNKAFADPRNNPFA